MSWGKKKKHASQNTLSLIHISEPTRLGMISYAVFCLKKKKKKEKTAQNKGQKSLRVREVDSKQNIQ